MRSLALLRKRYSNRLPHSGTSETELAVAFLFIIIVFSPSHEHLTKVSRDLPFPILRVHVIILFVQGTSMMTRRLGLQVVQAPEVWLGHGTGDVHNSLLDYATCLDSDSHCCHT